MSVVTQHPIGSTGGNHPGKGTVRQKSEKERQHPPQATKIHRRKVATKQKDVLTQHPRVNLKKYSEAVAAAGS